MQGLPIWSVSITATIPGCQPGATGSIPVRTAKPVTRGTIEDGGSLMTLILIVQWREQRSPKPQMRVRIFLRVPYALNSVVQSTRLIRGRSAVRICECVPIRSPRLKGRTPDSHSGNAGFKSRGDHQCYVGRSLMVKHRIVAPVNAG